MYTSIYYTCLHYTARFTSALVVFDEETPTRHCQMLATSTSTFFGKAFFTPLTSENWTSQPCCLQGLGSSAEQSSLYSCKLYMSTRQTWQATCYWNHSGQHHRLVFATHVLYLKVAGSRALSLRCNRLWLAMVNDQTLHSHNCLVSELTVLEQGVMMSWWLKKKHAKTRRSCPSTGFILHALCCNSYAIIHHNPNLQLLVACRSPTRVQWSLELNHILRCLCILPQVMYTTLFLHLEISKVSILWDITNKPAPLKKIICKNYVSIRSSELKPPSRLLKLSVAKLQNVLMQALHSMSSFVADPPNINGLAGVTGHDESPTQRMHFCRGSLPPNCHRFLFFDSPPKKNW